MRNLLILSQTVVGEVSMVLKHAHLGYVSLGKPNCIHSYTHYIKVYLWNHPKTSGKQLDLEKIWCSQRSAFSLGTRRCVGLFSFTNRRHSSARLKDGYYLLHVDVLILMCKTIHSRPMFICFCWKYGNMQATVNCTLNRPMLILFSTWHIRRRLYINSNTNILDDGSWI